MEQAAEGKSSRIVHFHGTALEGKPQIKNKGRVAASKQNS
jgi:hypothetical protein